MRPVCVLLLVLGLVSGVTAAAKTVPNARSVWVWNKPSAATLLSFAAAHDIRDIFVFVAAPVSDADLARFQSYRSEANAAGFHLYALGGEREWARDPAAAIEWETAALATGAFEGVHFDVEPVGRNCSGMRDYLQMLDAIRAAGSARVEVDVQYWWSKCPAEPGYGSITDAIVSRTDEVTVMSYRQGATGRDSIFAAGQYWLLRGSLARKPVRLGAEAAKDESADQTFYGSSHAVMNRVLRTVDRASAGYNSYDGIAIEDYAGWENLARR